MKITNRLSSIFNFSAIAFERDIIVGTVTSQSKHYSNQLIDHSATLSINAYKLRVYIHSNQ